MVRGVASKISIYPVLDPLCKSLYIKMLELLVAFLCGIFLTVVLIGGGVLGWLYSQSRPMQPKDDLEEKPYIPPQLPQVYISASCVLFMAPCSLCRTFWALARLAWKSEGKLATGSISLLLSYSMN